VNDIAASAKDPKVIINLLQDKYQFKLKGTGPTSFHLGCNFARDEDMTMCTSPRKYIRKLQGTYEHFFGSKPKQNITSPLEMAIILNWTCLKNWMPIASRTTSHSLVLSSD